MYLVDGQFFLEVPLQFLDSVLPEAADDDRQSGLGLSLQLHLPLLKLLPTPHLQVTGILQKYPYVKHFHCTYYAFKFVTQLSLRHFLS